MHILLATVLFLGGQTSHIMDLALGLKQAGRKVSLFLVGEKSYPDFAEYIRKLMKDNNIEIYSRKTVTSILPSVDIIHAHSSWTFPLAILWGERFNIPVVFTIHGLGIKDEDTLQKANALIAVGQRTGDSLPSIVREKVFYITNGVDITKFPLRLNERVKNSKKRVLFLGRLTPKKEQSLRELAIAVKEVGMELFIASDKKILLENGIFLGWQEDVIPLLYDNDIIFATGRALREGMAASLASFVLGERYFGLLTDPYLSPSNIDLSGLTGTEPKSDVIQKDLSYLNDDLYLKRCQNTARYLVERYYSLDFMAKRTIEVYESVAKAKVK